MSMHVVHVEDETQLRDILGVAFRAADPDIRLLQFVSGDEALPYIEANGKQVDLFILDIRLPGTMNGVDIAQKVRALECPGFVVLTSAYGAPRSEVLKSLHCEYFPKPWHLLEVTQKLLQYKLESIQLPSPYPLSSLPGSDTAMPPAKQVSPGVQPDLQILPAENKPSQAAAPSTDSETPADKLCPSCGKGVLPGQALCLSCGAVLGVAYPSQTRHLEKPCTPTDSRTRPRGSVALSNRQVILEIDNGRSTLVLPKVEVVVIGRGTPTVESGSVSVVTLDDYGAEAKGVSRRHLKVARRGNLVFVSDLGSTNGTWINGRRILPNRERLLREDDEIRLGELRMKVLFRSASVDNVAG